MYNTITLCIYVLIVNYSYFAKMLIYLQWYVLGPVALYFAIN